MGIEPTLSAWKAEVLPLNYARMIHNLINSHALAVSARSASNQLILWRGKDSNLRRRKPSDLQSDPFGRSGTPPQSEREFCLMMMVMSIVMKKFINKFQTASWNRKNEESFVTRTCLTILAGLKV